MAQRRERQAKYPLKICGLLRLLFRQPVQRRLAIIEDAHLKAPVLGGGLEEG